MAAYVDISGCVVRNGERTWPFAVDCRDGAARIALDAGEFTLRPLGWREKRNLARFSHLGETFLQQQLLRLSLADAAVDLPTAAEEVAALSTLARWLNAPDGRAGLPLDVQLLARVTLEVSRMLHLTPDAFDELPATEVEILWQAGRAGTAQEEAAVSRPTTRSAEAADTTRIIVVPDADGAAQRPAREQRGSPPADVVTVPGEKSGAGEGTTVDAAPAGDTGPAETTAPLADAMMKAGMAVPVPASKPRFRVHFGAQQTPVRVVADAARSATAPNPSSIASVVDSRTPAEIANAHVARSDRSEDLSADPAGTKTKTVIPGLPHPIVANSGVGRGGGAAAAGVMANIDAPAQLAEVDTPVAPRSLGVVAAIDAPAEPQPVFKTPLPVHWLDALADELDAAARAAGIDQED